MTEARKKRRNLEQERIDRVLARAPEEAEIGVLAQAIQDSLEFVSDRAVDSIAEHVGSVPDVVRARLRAIPACRREPQAPHRVTICTGRTCARRGGAELVKRARAFLGSGVFESSGDGAIYLEPFRCFGQCAMAPNIRIDGGVRGAMTEERFVLLLDMLRRKAAQG